MASRQALRRAWWQVHKWTGLALMILLIPLGLSGVVLTWDDAIDQALNPQRYAVHGIAALAPSAYAAAAVKLLDPDERIASIRYPEGEGPVVVMASRAAAGGRGNSHKGPRNRLTLWLDPVDGHLLDKTNGDSGLVRLAHDFHGQLLLPALGRTLVGLLGVAMFLMAAGDVWLWWPTVSSFRSGLRWKRGDRRTETNLHHAVGFWIAWPLAFQAFTGVWIAWPQMLTSFGLTPQRIGPMERMRMLPVARTALDVDRVLATARAADPGEFRSIMWPSDPKGGWHVALATTKGQAEIVVDDATGVATIAPPRGGLAQLMRHLHDGTTLGIGWRVVMVAWGLAPTLLGITGLIMWWRGRRWRADLARRRERVRETGAV